MRLQAHEATDAVVEMHHVVAWHQLSEAFQRDGPTESTPTADPSRASENFVVGKDQERRVGANEFETSFQRAYHHLRAGRKRSALPSQDFLQPLGLPFIVAQEQGAASLRGSLAQQGIEPSHVALDAGWRSASEREVAALFFSELKKRKRGQDLTGFDRVEEQFVRLGRRLAPVAQLGVEPLYVFPRAVQGGAPLELAQSHEHGFAWEEIEQGARHHRAGVGVAPRAEVHGQHVRLVELARGTLIEDVEAPDRRYLISPELNSNGIRRSKREQVQ